MDAFSEEDKIYFSTKNKIACASYSPFLNKEIVSRIVTKSEFKHSTSKKQSFTNKLKKMHTAEHQVYNCFKKKISKLGDNCSSSDLIKAIPSNEEVKNTESFSFFCGTTQSYFLISFGLLNLLLNFVFHSFIALVLSFIFSYGLIYIIQKKYYLSKAEDIEINLAKAALRKVLEGEKTS